jgi:2-dehydropantoate 2-reductase
MKILCIGAGAIGICIGGSLAAVGADVTFLIKPQQMKNMQGQTLTTINQCVSHPVTKFEIVNDLRELKGIDIDCVLIAVKAFDTEQVIKQLKDSQLFFKSILCLQNGVENEGKLRDAFPQADIIGASIVSAVSHWTRPLCAWKKIAASVCAAAVKFFSSYSSFSRRLGSNPGYIKT